jgi:hypothetical protein
MDEYDLMHQIGRGNVLAISGGRFDTLTNEDGEVTDLLLPVAYGYRVRINLAANDTYTVRREFVRGGKVYEKGKVEDVHCTEVGEVAYRASCYVNVDFGEAA